MWEVKEQPGGGFFGMLRKRFLSFGMVLTVGFLLLVSLVISATLFAFIYRYLPDTRVAWRDVWAGAAMTTILFVLGKHLLGLYLGRGVVGLPMAPPDRW